MDILSRALSAKKKCLGLRRVFMGRREELTEQSIGHKLELFDSR